MPTVIDHANDYMFDRQTADLDPPAPEEEEEVNADNFSVRWSGMIHTPAAFTGSYTVQNAGE